MTITHPSSLALGIIVQVALGSQPMALVTLRSGQCVSQGRSAPIGPHQEESDTHSECWYLWPRDPVEMLWLYFYPHCLPLPPCLSFPPPPPPHPRQDEDGLITAALSFPQQKSQNFHRERQKKSWFGPMSKPEAFCFLGTYEQKDFPLPLLEVSLPHFSIVCPHTRKERVSFTQ